MQLPVDKDLAFGNVPSQIGDGVRDIWINYRTVVGHCEDGDLGDGAVAALDSAGAFVDCREIRVHVSGIPATTGDFLAGSRDFAQCVGIRAHVG